jgi:hypothetical protein
MGPGADDQYRTHLRVPPQPVCEVRDFVHRSKRPHGEPFGVPPVTIVVEKEESSLGRDAALQLQEARPCGEVELGEAGQVKWDCPKRTEQDSLRPAVLQQFYTVCLATAAPGKHENQICRLEWIGANQPVAQEFQQTFEKTQV